MSNKSKAFIEETPQADAQGENENEKEKVMTINELREKYGLRPIEGGDVVIINVSDIHQ